MASEVGSATKKSTCKLMAWSQFIYHWHQSYHVYIADICAVFCKNDNSEKKKTSTTEGKAAFLLCFTTGYWCLFSFLLSLVTFISPGNKIAVTLLPKLLISSRIMKIIAEPATRTKSTKLCLDLWLAKPYIQLSTGGTGTSKPLTRNWRPQRTMPEQKHAANTKAAPRLTILS